mmetsp:Transcript_14375/g.24956  ORF Transcript_14375/g.24956 Transcript_14375/m.24956 type:complete len:98 (+) Transcript_14375:692-985(+)
MLINKIELISAGLDLLVKNPMHQLSDSEDFCKSGFGKSGHAACVKFCWDVPPSKMPCGSSKTESIIALIFIWQPMQEACWKHMFELIHLLSTSWLPR